MDLKVRVYITQIWKSQRRIHLIRTFCPTNKCQVKILMCNCKHKKERDNILKIIVNELDKIIDLSVHLKDDLDALFILKNKIRDWRWS